MTGREALGAVRVVFWVPLSPKNRSCPPTGGPAPRPHGPRLPTFSGNYLKMASRHCLCSSPKNRSCPPTGGPGGRVRRRPRPVDEVAPSSTSTEGRTQSPRGHGHARCSFFVGGVVGPKAARPPPTYLLCTQVLRQTCFSYENARFYPTCARYFPSCHSLYVAD